MAREVAMAPPCIPALHAAGEQIHDGWETFGAEFSSVLLQGDAERRRTWIAALRAAIDEALVDVPGLTYKGYREHVTAEIERWKSESDPFVLWEMAKGDTYYRDYPAIELYLLRRIDQQLWLEVLDTIPAPSLMWYVVWLSSIVEDPELLEELLILAPPLFDNQGAWTRSSAILIMVRLIRTYAERVHRALVDRIFAAHDDSEKRAIVGQGCRDFGEIEITLRLQKFYRSLLTRADGQYIAYRLLDDLIIQSFSSSASPSEDHWTADRSVVEALGATLAASKDSVEKARSIWQELNGRKEEDFKAEAMKLRLHGSQRQRVDERKGEGQRILYENGLPLLLGALVVLSHSGWSQAEGERVWSWFRALLIGRSPGIDVAMKDAVLDEVSKRLGEVLAKFREPSKVWHELYRELEPQRRRGQLGFRYEGDLQYDYESTLLIYVGLYGCALCVKNSDSEASHAQSHEFFWDLYDSSRRLWLTAAHDIGESKRCLVAACFAFMPAIFGDAMQEMLARAIRPIYNDHWLLIRACTHLRQNGIEPEQMKDILTGVGINLEGALRDAYQWSTLTKQKNELPHDFRTLADALGYKIATPQT
jgi:hypothetical protein